MGDKQNTDHLVEIKLTDEENFLKIKSCHILHKRGRYYIVHFKELFELDGLESNLDEKDIARRNTISNLLAEWGLCELIDEEKTKEPVLNIKQLKILSHKEKCEWELCPKYHIGKKY